MLHRKGVFSSTRGYTFLCCKKLKGVEESLKKFADTISPLQAKVGCFLWQLPPHFPLDQDRLKNFCRSLQRNRLLRQKDHTFEFRKEDWFQEAVYQILKEHNFALCFADAPQKIGEPRITADFLYIRFHGSTSRYDSHYTDAELLEWVKKIKEWLNENKVKKIYAYFNNDAQGFAPQNAMTFRKMLEGKLS